jgi:hypothetical protein
VSGLAWLPRERSARVRLAYGVALAADFLQVVAIPVFGLGFLSPLLDAIDIVTGIALIALLGWHLAFLPTFIVEVLPIADLFPTWTGAVWLVTRGSRKQLEVERGPAPRSS